MAAMVAATGTTIYLPPLGVETSTVIESSNGRVVRFESQCILIPEMRTAGLSRSYSLPLWRKKPSSDADPESPPAASSPDSDTHVVLKVPIPRFISRVSRSPSRTRTLSSAGTPKPLSPCLVHRSPSSPPTTPIRPVRRPSSVVSMEKKRDDMAVTIPLRECCHKCTAITEESFMEGDNWQEKFTRGARRRRSSSLDGSGVAPRYNRPPAFSLTVDEVDKRRKSMDITDNDSKRLLQPFGSPLRVTPPMDSQMSGILSNDASNSSGTSSSEVSTNDFPRSSPIQEEDENQLFPLPSPRRSPASSASPSPAPSPKASPLPSPHVSSTCITPYSGVSATRTELPPGSISARRVRDFGNSINKKLPQPYDRYQSHRLPSTPPAFQLTLTIPRDFDPTFDWDPDHFSPAVPVKKASRKFRAHARALPPPPISSAALKARTKPLPSRGRAVTKPLPTVPLSVSVPMPEAITTGTPSTSPPLPMSAPPPISPPPSRPTPRSASESRSPTRASLSPRRVSAPFLDALRGVGADMLKGVNSFGGSGGGRGIGPI